MKTKSLFIFAFLPFILLSCIDKEKEKQLDEREKILNEKEQAFSAKENELVTLQKMRDSIFAKKDSATTKIWPEEITGIWTGKTICTESNCPEYAIGDVRSENWDFTSDGHQLLSKVSNKGTLIRTYSGDFSDRKIFLDFKTDSTSKKQVDMNIVFDDLSSNKIKGTRLITVDNKCSAKFNIELIRQTK